MDKYNLAFTSTASWAFQDNNMYSGVGNEGDVGRPQTAEQWLRNVLMAGGQLLTGAGNIGKAASMPHGTMDALTADLDFAKRVDDFAKSLVALKDPLQSSIDKVIEARDADMARATALGFETSAMQEYYAISLQRAREDKAMAKTVRDYGYAAREATLAGDTLAASLDSFDAKTADERLKVSRESADDIVRVEKILAGERSKIISDYNDQVAASMSPLRGLVDSLTFGSASAASPDSAFFSGLTRLNKAKETAASSKSQSDIADFTSVANAFLPQAREYLGSTTKYQDIVKSVLDTAIQVGGGFADPAGIGAAVTRGASATVDAIDELTRQVREQTAQIINLNERLAAMQRRAA